MSLPAGAGGLLSTSGCSKYNYAIVVVSVTQAAPPDGLLLVPFNKQTCLPECPPYAGTPGEPVAVPFGSRPWRRQLGPSWLCVYPGAGEVLNKYGYYPQFDPSLIITVQQAAELVQTRNDISEGPEFATYSIQQFQPSPARTTVSQPSPARTTVRFLIPPLAQQQYQPPSPQPQQYQQPQSQQPQQPSPPPSQPQPQAIPKIDPALLGGVIAAAAGAQLAAGAGGAQLTNVIMPIITIAVLFIVMFFVIKLLKEVEL